MVKVKRTVLKSKLHRATVTDANLEYEGSITIDKLLMEHADIWPFERVEVYNIDNGARFATYAIEGEPGKGDICINGAAAHHAKPGHKVIICTYTEADESHSPLSYKPKITLLDSQNKPKKELDI
jgi:aspartate 1-decarboxylase